MFSMDHSKLEYVDSILIICLVAMVLLVITPFLLSSFFIGLLVEVLIFGIFAMSLDILVGYTNLPSLGHAAFFGISGYTVALLSLNVTQNAFAGLLAGIGSAFVLAVLFGLLALRTKGVYFLMITLALAQVLWAIAFKWRAVTGGSDGLTGIPRPVLWDNSSELLYNVKPFYFFVLVIFVVSFFILYRIVRSPFGLALKGIHDSESRMEALGYNVWLYKYIAFLVSGIFGGVAGTLYIYFNRFVSVSDLSLQVSAIVFIMVILGGAGTLFGPIIGSLVIIFLEHFVGVTTDRWLLVLGLIYILVVMYMPEGIIGTLKKLALQGYSGALSDET